MVCKVFGMVKQQNWSKTRGFLLRANATANKKAPYFYDLSPCVLQQSK